MGRALVSRWPIGGLTAQTSAVKTSAEDYAWINDAAISEAGCVTVVAAADRRAVLAAFGAQLDTARDPGALTDLDFDAGSGGPIYVAEVGDALVVIEDNGFQGSRPEVLCPASKASGANVAASFFWNVNAVTAFSAARRGKLLFSVELLGAEDDDLDGVPKPLRRLVLFGGSEDGDLLGAGLALVAGFTETAFSASILDGCTVYDIEPPTDDLLTYGPDYEYTYGMRDAAPRLAVVSPERQRLFADWATIAAVRESGLAEEPAVQRILDQLGTGKPPTLPPTIEGLARATAKKHVHFARLWEELEAGSFWEMPPHPYYEAPNPGSLDGLGAISLLEGDYLGQRRYAVEALRYVAHTDPLSAAIACANSASIVFACGRTVRGWTFTENDRGRFHTGTDPNPRHERFIQAATTLITELALPESAEGAVQRANAALPRPLTTEERTAAIQADAQAAAHGAFTTYQTEPPQGH